MQTVFFAKQVSVPYMKKSYLLCSILSTLLLLGAGCNFSKQNTAVTTTSPAQPVIDTTTQQQAYLFCTQKGYDIQIRFVAAQNRNTAYCILNPDTECDSIAFMQGTCPNATTTPEDAIAQMFEPIPGDSFPLRLCEPIANPVCGVDNNTYTNGCIAEFLGVKIDHQGSCDRPAAEASAINDSPVVDISNPPKNTNTGRPISSSNSASQPTPGTTKSATTNNWVEIPLSLLQSTAGMDNRIDRCTYGGDTTFFVHDDFPTLYSATGEALCYPEHDINNNCPEYIMGSAYKNSCTKVSR